MKINLRLATNTKSLPAFIVTALLLLSSTLVFSQAESPYSRYGLGVLRPQVFSANVGMGFLSAPYASAMYINTSNPASYASLAQSTFEIGALIDGNRIGAFDSSYRSGGGAVNHFVVALKPRAKHVDWAVCLGLLPYSNVNYNFEQARNDSALGGYDEVYTGSGSLYQTFTGAAIKVNGFSIGFNVGLIFGKLEYQKIAAFTDTIYALNTRNITSANLKGFSYNVGIQYQKILNPKRENGDQRSAIFATFGAYGSGGTNMAAKISTYWDRFYYDINDNLIVTDTLQSSFNQKGKISMPYNLGAGIMFGNERFWMVGADFKYTNWSSYTTPLDNGGLANSWQVSVGAQVVPQYDAFRAYLKSMQYRLGAYYGNSEISVGGDHLRQGGATLGLGFPFYKNAGHFNVSGDFGSLGGNNNDAIRLNYYRFVLGFVLNDPGWFGKHNFE